MKENNWNLTFTESFLKTLKEVHKIQVPTSSLAMGHAWKAVVPNYKIGGAYAALNEIVARQKEWEKLVVPTTSFSAMVKELLPAVKLDTHGIAMSALASIDTSVLIALRESVSVAALEKADWSWLSDVHSEVTEVDDQERVAKEVSPEVRSQIAADITDVLSDPENMHVTSRNKFQDWMRERPENAMLFIQTLCVIIQTFLTALALVVNTCQARTVKAAQVYEEPTSTSNVVYNLTVENNVTVIGDVPYYYEVEFVNPETGEEMIGYIYKGNLAVEEPNETEAQQETGE